MRWNSVRRRTIYCLTCAGQNYIHSPTSCDNGPISTSVFVKKKVTEFTLFLVGHLKWIGSCLSVSKQLTAKITYWEQSLVLDVCICHLIRQSCVKGRANNKMVWTTASQHSGPYPVWNRSSLNITSYLEKNILQWSLEGIVTRSLPNVPGAM